MEESMKKIRKKRASLLSAFLVFTMIFTNAAAYIGDGMIVYAEDKIFISTAEELQKIGVDEAYPLSGDYVLNSDIDMEGINFTPIGGGVGSRGASSGANVFTGTFDGGGHIISNLSIQKTGSSQSDWQYGMFGIVGSDNDSDKASVKNLILTGLDVNVDMTGSAYLSLGGLAGEVNHNANIDNVAIIDGMIKGNTSNGSDVVGAGGLIGEMRYSAQGVNGVTISNIYVGANVISGSSTDHNYVSGIIGRIAKSNPTSISACVFTGNTNFKGGSGYGISGGDMNGNISNCYYISGTASTGTAISESEIKAGTLLSGLNDNYWIANEGSYMMLKQCAESETLSSILALSNLSLNLAEGDTVSAITKNFTVPMSIQIGEVTENISWNCDSEVLSVGADGTVTVNEVYMDTDCTLTVTTTSGKTKDFQVTVKTNVSLTINQEYAVVGEPLTATLTGGPENVNCTYEWQVDGTVKSNENTYTPTSNDLEKMLTVTATISDDYAATYSASMYLSKLPVLYVNTEGNQDIVSKENYINGDFKIQGNAKYNSTNTTLYDGAIKIRGRGNTTWGYAKKPYKIKLDEKTDLFGFGKNKHWVLLANYTDESHMRNTLAYNLSGEMGMPYMQSVHIDLILNGEYRGTYQFCEQVKIASSRVNIHDWEDYAGDIAKAVYEAEKDNGLTKDDQDAIETQLAETDMSWLTTKKFTYKNKEYDIKTYLPDIPDATGGFLIELDSYYDEYSKFKTSKNQPLQFKSPEFIATNNEAMNDVKDYINAFENAISTSDFTTVYHDKTVSYSQLFDMDSLVQFWLVNELFMNVDAMKKSTYLYKDIDGLFKMGPIWDMDWSSNSLVSSSQGSGTYNTWQTTKFSDSAQANQWYKSIIKDPYFAVKAYEWYTQMREKMGEIVAQNGTLDTYQTMLLESANANTTMWYSRENNKNFNTQTATLKTYLTNRLNWLDNQFKSPETLADSLGYKSAGGITVNAEDITTKETGITSITANVTNSSVKSVAFMINGVKQETIEVVDGKATIEVPQTALITIEKETVGTSQNTVGATKHYNTVQVYGLNTNGSVVLSGSNKVTDFEKFYVEKQEDNTGGDNTGDKPGDNTGGDNTGDKPGDNTGGDNTGDKPGDNTEDKPGDNTGGDNTGDKPGDNTGGDNTGDKPGDNTGDKPGDKPEDNTGGDNTGNNKPEKEIPAVGKVLTYTKGKTQYKVTKSGEKGGTVEYFKNKNSKATSITIPATVSIDGISYKVTSIAENALKGNKKLVSVKIGSNITKIKKNTFSSCTKLKSVTIGKNVTAIEDKAFYKCAALEKVVIPTKVKKIGKSAFESCTKLKSATIGKNVATIGDRAFYKCTSLTKITIPTKITKIGKSVFESCTKLKSVAISKNVATIGDRAFYKCTALEKITIPTKVKKIGKSAFESCTKLKSVTISKNVTTIGDRAFYKCISLTKIVIPEKVTKIGKSAFEGCTKLKSATIGKNVTTVEEKAFYKCTSLAKIVIPEKVTKIGKSAFEGCKKINSAVISAGVKSIGSKAFANCSKLKIITIKTTKLTTKNVGSQAFKGINSKATIKVPAKKIKAYRSLLKKRGVTGKNQVIKK